MKLPLFAMTVLGITLVAYGLFSLLRTNAEVRAQVMQQLPVEYQVKLTNILNNPIDLGNRASTVEAIDPTATCTGPAGPQKCVPGAPNQTIHTIVQPRPTPPSAAQAEAKKDYDPATASTADTMKELGNIKKNQEETNKALDEIMKE